MAYYNNNYYPNNFGGYSPQQQQFGIPQGYGYQPQPQQTPQVPQQSSIPSPLQSLNGKIVDSIDVVRATEIPLGSYGVFPKADLSEIFVKVWDKDGQIKLLSFQPVTNMKSETNNQFSDEFQKISDMMTNLNNKIDALASSVKGGAPAERKGVANEF